MHENLAVEHRVGGTVENSLIQFLASCPRLDMFNFGVIVDMLFVSGQVKTVQHTFGSFPVKQHMNIVADERTVESHRMGRKAAIAADIRLQSGDEISGARFILQTVIIDDRPGSTNNLGDDIS